MKAFLQKPVVYAILFWCVAFAVIAILADFIAMPIVAGHLKFREEVPSVIGMTPQAAEAKLAEEGLVVAWNPEGRWSAEVPAGNVLNQVPIAGRVVKNGRTVYLTASKGTREVNIPELRGNSQRQAEISLNRLGLVLGKIVEGAHASIPGGVVIRTEPGAGKVARMGEKVNIVVSAGASEGKTRLPDFTNRSLADAKRAIDSLGFTVGTVVPRKDTAHVPNTVVEQQPRSGEFLEPGFLVDLVVSE